MFQTLVLRGSFYRRRHSLHMSVWLPRVGGGGSSRGRPRGGVPGGFHHHALLEDLKWRSDRARSLRRRRSRDPSPLRRPDPARGTS